MPTMGDLTLKPSGILSPEVVPDSVLTSVPADAAARLSASAPDCGTCTTAGAIELCRLTLTDSSPSCISISAMLDSSSISISFLTFRISIATVIFRSDVLQHLKPDDNPEHRDH